MTADLLAMPVAPPEWRHSGPYLVIALALHALVLALAPSLLPEKPGVPPAQTITVTFEQPATLTVPLAPPPPPAAVSPRPPAVPDRPRQTPVPRGAVLAVVAQPGAKPAPFSVAESAVASADERPAVAPASASSNVPVPVSAARYDAAYLHNPRPAYPPLSRRLGEEGKVLLRVRVSREGLAAAVDLEKSSNFERLDEAARAVVSRWRFVPARRGDEAIEATVIVPIVFRLDG
jgi:protein TonB